MAATHTVFRLVLRCLLKPLAQPWIPLRFQRALLDAAAWTMRRPPGLLVEHATLAGRPTLKLSAVAADPQCHLLYLHGGAYVEGSPRSHTALAGNLGAQAQAVTWLPHYRLAPEHPCPAAIDDALGAYRELLAQGIPATRIVIAGDSAGGGLALATACAIRDSGLPQPAALALLSPWLDLSHSGASAQARAAVEPMLNLRWLEWAAGLYAGARPRTQAQVSPLFADLAGLPPMLVHVGDDEILLDDSVRLAQRARAAGVDCGLRVFPRLWHVFQAQAGLIPEADESLQELGAFLRRHGGR